MQAYGEGFARAYDRHWAGFARQVAPLIFNFYAETLPGRAKKAVLDLCCGTGQLALHFLTQGYRVVGLDLSASMLALAREKARAFVETGQARFVQADASDFTLEERFGLIVSTYDALNHLENLNALRRCFACARAVSDGLFIFDLNTKLGLRRWNNIHVDEAGEDVIITRGIYDGEGERAWTRISGFVHLANGLYERFEESAFNSAFDLAAVKEALHEAGWPQLHFALVRDLRSPIAEPELEGRIFVVAQHE